MNRVRPQLRLGARAEREFADGLVAAEGSLGMTVSESTYRLTQPVTAVVCKGTQQKLESLRAGSIIISFSAADRAGIIEARCEGLPVLIFRRDLEERSVNITGEQSFVEPLQAQRMSGRRENK